jgi:hypothetical protein
VAGARWPRVVDAVRELQPKSVVLAGALDGLTEALRMAHVDAEPLGKSNGVKRALAIVGGEPDAKVAAKLASTAERVLVVDDPLSERFAIEWIAELAAHGLLRASFELPLSACTLLASASTGEVLRGYERLLRRLQREEEVARFLSHEYQEAVASRDRELERASPHPHGARAKAPPDSELPELLEELMQMRMRFAPDGSLRTRALDWSAAQLRLAAGSVLKLFDARDAALDRARVLARTLGRRGSGS